MDYSIDHALREHIRSSINDASNGQVTLPDVVFSLPGFSSPKVRQLLNNLVRDGDVYLEVGLMWGATFVSALYGHKPKSAFGYDNFSEFDATESAMKENVAKCLSGQPVTLLVRDCFEPLPNDLRNVTVFFYDGNHSSEAQAKALNHFLPSLADDVIFVVDDWNWDSVRIGTYEGIRTSGLRLASGWSLNTSKESDHESWWNGLFVCHLSKRSSEQ